MNWRRRTTTLKGIDWDGKPTARSGLARLKDFSVITELKVASTQAKGLRQHDVLQDFRKLSHILAAAERQYPDHPLPAAFVGVFDNHHKRRFNFDKFEERLAAASVRQDIKLLRWSPTDGRIGT